MCATKSKPPAAAQKIAVIGGGWAGCTAAVILSEHHRVTLFESVRTLGGRARAVEIQGQTLDNGQHILLGAYQETLRLMRWVGIDPREVLLRLPLQMCHPQDRGGMHFVASRLPAPWHLIAALWRATGLTRQDKLALARFATAARQMGWELHTDCSVMELLARFDQTARVTQLLWRPLCLAALNTPPDRASAQIFLNVLRDSLGARRAASDMLIPRVDLTALFPQRAGEFIVRHGGSVHPCVTVTGLARQNGRWQLDLQGADRTHDDRHFDAVVIATQPAHARTLLGAIATTDHWPAFEYESITTCYLQYERYVTLSRPFFALIDDPVAGQWGQFVFDRGILDDHQAGLLAVVVSASRLALAGDHTELANSMAAQLSAVFQMPELAHPLWTQVISEKRATYACTPALHRPDNAMGIDGLVIAGDYTAGDYPATLEAAVRSGLAAAQTLLLRSAPPVLR